MASYKTHAKFNVMVTLPIVTAGLIYFFNPSIKYILTFIGSFIYGTYFMNPDLDLANQIKLFSIRGLLTVPFRSYSLVFRHRGLSHSFLFGTISRIIWLIAYLIIASYLLLKVTPDRQSVAHYFYLYRDYLVFVLGGLFIADTSHLLLD